VEAILEQAAALSRADQDAPALRALVRAASIAGDSGAEPALRSRLIHDLAAASSGADVRDAGAAHLGSVLAMATLPSAGIVATASLDRTVRLWRTDGRPLVRLTGFGGAVRALGFASAAPRLVTADDQGQVAVWEIPSGEPVTVFDAPRLSQLGEVALMPRGDGAIVAAGRGVWLRPLDGPRTTLMYQGNGRAVSLDVDPRGRRVASGHDDGTVMVWHADTLEVRVLSTASATAPESTPVAVRFWPGSADRLVALTEAGGVRVWELEGEEWPSESWELGARALSSLAFMPDGSAAAAVGDGEVIRLPLAGLPLVRRRLEGPRTTAVAFTPGGALFVGGIDGGVRVAPLMPALGDPLGSRPRAILGVRADQSARAWLVLDAGGGLAALPGDVSWTGAEVDGEVEPPTLAIAVPEGIVASSGAQILRWAPGVAAEGPASNTELCVAEDLVVALASGPGGAPLYADASGTVARCTDPAGPPIAQIPGAQVTALCANDGLVVAGTDKGSVHAFSGGGTPRWELGPDGPIPSPVAKLALLDGAVVLRATLDGRVTRHGAHGELMASWTLPGCRVTAMDVAEAAGQVAVGCDDGSLRVLRLAQPGGEALSLSLHRGAIRWVGLDGGAGQAVTAGDDGRLVRASLELDALAPWVSRACAWIREDPAVGPTAVAGCPEPRL
jgi:WD40 repeat protein